MGELHRIGPPSRPGPFRRDIVHEVRVARDQVDHAWDLVWLVTPPFPDGLADEIGSRLADALLELDEVLELLAESRAS